MTAFGLGGLFAAFGLRGALTASGMESAFTASASGGAVPAPGVTGPRAVSGLAGVAFSGAAPATSATWAPAVVLGGTVTTGIGSVVASPRGGVPGPAAGAGGTIPAGGRGPPTPPRSRRGNGMGPPPWLSSSAWASASAWIAARTRSRKAADSAGRATRAGGRGPSFPPRTRCGNPDDGMADVGPGAGTSAVGTSAARSWRRGFGGGRFGGGGEVRGFGGGRFTGWRHEGRPRGGGHESGCRVRRSLLLFAPGRLGRRSHPLEERLRQDRARYPRRRTRPVTRTPHPARQGRGRLERRRLPSALPGRDIVPFLPTAGRRLG